jgi:hypothetical protein
MGKLKHSEQTTAFASLQMPSVTGVEPDLDTGSPRSAALEGHRRRVHGWHSTDWARATWHTVVNVAGNCDATCALNTSQRQLSIRLQD